MRIELKTRSLGQAGDHVGTADGKELIYIGRIPYIDGVAHRQADLAPYLAIAVDEAASRIWGGEWNSDLSRVTGLNRRTVTRDRIEKFGLPSWVLGLIGHAANAAHPRAVGHFMLALAAMTEGTEIRGGRPLYVLPRDREIISGMARSGLDGALMLLSYARDERSKHRVSQAPDDTNS